MSAEFLIVSISSSVLAFIERKSLAIFFQVFVNKTGVVKDCFCLLAENLAEGFQQRLQYRLRDILESVEGFDAKVGDTRPQGLEDMAFAAKDFNQEFRISGKNIPSAAADELGDQSHLIFIAARQAQNDGGNCQSKARMALISSGNSEAAFLAA